MIDLDYIVHRFASRTPQPSAAALNALSEEFPTFGREISIVIIKAVYPTAKSPCHPLLGPSLSALIRAAKDDKVNQRVRLAACYLELASSRNKLASTYRALALAINPAKGVLGEAFIDALAALYDRDERRRVEKLWLNVDKVLRDIVDHSRVNHKGLITPFLDNFAFCGAKSPTSKRVS